MARDEKGVGRRGDARKEVFQICVSKVRTFGGRVAETDGQHVAACPVMLFVDRVAKGLRRLERRYLRRRDGDRLPGSRIASLTCGAASHGELPEPRTATGSARASASAMVENTAPTIRSAAALVVEVSAATCETSSALVMLSFPRAAVGLRRMGRVHIKRAASGKATQPAVRERSGRTGVDEPVMSASTRPFRRWRALGSTRGELRLDNRCGRTHENA